MLTKDRAVCIRAVDYSETSQIVTFFARLAGKISAIAKGSKRAKSAFDGPIEVLSYGDIVFTGADKEKLATLTEYQQQPMRGGLRRNLFALDCVLFAAELLGRLTHDGDPHLILFDQFVQLIGDLDEQATGPRRDILLRLVLFQLALLREVGLRPNLKTCANCKRSFSSDWRESYFSSSANGLVCRDCEMNFPERVQLSGPAARALANLGQIAKTPENVLDEIEAVLIYHFTETLGQRPKMAAHVLKSRPK
ncbi:MAG: DNA repair protein RecO [Sedimentisphaerales bacterium]|jgi:DNA repair protein RecO (recombination protein O)|nr:DNA repair protein RecO [Sedimentisphaerales bacterium]HNY79693.1 DNA repair protein RecO [Sedimentisphaerales bacterium]HOC64800.1 DNA repair protein RecO [Sedimentisphaerales bacterium]HOH65682.1 DNA repair protein RecO [Sedimentisphaerales bacterium]HPY51812.1 DNA repair protein RecO [Sedimentisphaerales bacterium]